MKIKTFDEFFHEMHPTIPMGKHGITGELMLTMQTRYYATASKFFDYIADQMLNREVKISYDSPIVIDPDVLRRSIEEFERQEREKPHKKLCVDMDDDLGAAIEPGKFRNQIKPPDEK